MGVSANSVTDNRSLTACSQRTPVWISA